MKKQDKLTGYKVLVLINLAVALVVLALRLVFATAVRQIVAGESTGVDGPAEFAVAGIGALIIMPVTLVLLIVSAVIMIWQSAKNLEQKTLSTKSVWFVLAVIVVVIEIIAAFV